MSDAYSDYDEAERLAKARGRAAERQERHDHLIREDRLSSMTQHQQIVNSLADDYNTAIQYDDLQGFFERTAVRVLMEPEPKRDRVRRDALISRVENIHQHLAELRAALLTNTR